jgi:hypothetical protein
MRVREASKSKTLLFAESDSKKGQAKLVLFWSKGKETPRPDGFRVGIGQTGKKQRLLFDASSFMARRGALSARVAHSGGKGSGTAVASVYHVPLYTMYLSSMPRIMSSF